MWVRKHGEEEEDEEKEKRKTLFESTNTLGACLKSLLLTLRTGMAVKIFSDGSLTLIHFGEFSRATISPLNSSATLVIKKKKCTRVLAGFL